MNNKRCGANTGWGRWYASIEIWVALPKICRVLSLELSTVDLINLGFSLNLGFKEGIVGISLPLLDLSISYYSTCD